MTSSPTVKVAACHVAPIYLNAQASTEKALSCIDRACENGASLVVLAESFIPGFPLFACTGAPVDNEGCFARFVEQSIYADGPEIASLRAKAKDKSIVLSVGFSERSRNSVACLWNSNVLIGEDGSVLAHHRVRPPILTDTATTNSRHTENHAHVLGEARVVAGRRGRPARG